MSLQWPLYHSLETDSLVSYSKIMHLFSIWCFAFQNFLPSFEVFCGENIRLSHMIQSLHSTWLLNMAATNSSFSLDLDLVIYLALIILLIIFCFSWRRRFNKKNRIEEKKHIPIWVVKSLVLNLLDQTTAMAFRIKTLGMVWSSTRWMSPFGTQ